MKFISASDLKFSGREGRVVFKDLGIPEGGDEYGEIQEENEVKKLSQEELNKLLEKIVEIESDNEEDGDNYNAGGRSWISKAVRELGLGGEIVQDLRQFEDENSGVLLNFIYLNQKKAFSLFTDRIDDKTFEFQFYGNNFLEDQTSLDDYFGSDKKYLKKGNDIAVRTANGYKIFSSDKPGNLDKPLIVHSGDWIESLDNLTLQQSEELNKNEKLKVWNNSEALKTKQPIINDIKIQILTYKISINKANDFFGSSQIKDKLGPALVNEIKQVLDGFKLDLDGINFSDVAELSSKEFMEKKTKELENKVNQRIDDLQNLFLAAGDKQQAFLEIVEKLMPMFEIQNKEEIETKNDLLKRNKEDLNELLGDETKFVIEKFDSIAFRTFKDDDLAEILGDNEKLLNQEQRKTVIKLLNKRSIILMGRESVKAQNEVISNVRRKIEIIKKKIELWEIIESLGMDQELELKREDVLRGVSLSKLKPIIENYFNNYKKEILDPVSIYTEPESPQSSVEETSFNETPVINNQKDADKYVRLKGLLDSIEELEQEELRSKETHDKKLQKIFEAYDKYSEKNLVLNRILNFSPEEQDGFWKKVEGYRHQKKKEKEKATTAYSGAYLDIDINSTEAQDKINDALGIGEKMPNFTLVTFDKTTGFPIYGVGDTKQEIVVNEKNEMYPYNINTKGSMAERFKVPVEPDNVAITQVNWAMIKANYWTSDYEVTNETREMGQFKLQNFIKEIYQWGGVRELQENEVNGWVNLQLELRARGKDMRYFWAKMKVLDKNGEIVDEDAKKVRSKVVNAIDSARVGNFEFLDDLFTDMKKGFLAKKHNISDRKLKKLSGYLEKNKISISEFLQKNVPYSDKEVSQEKQLPMKSRIEEAIDKL